MYTIVEQFACGHEQKFETSKNVYELCHTNSNHRQFLLKEPPKEGIFSKMFRRRSWSTQKKGLPARFKQIHDICQQCKYREAERHARAGTPQQLPYDFAEARAQRVRKAAKALRAGKSQFQCSKCKAEGKALVYLAARAGNNGVCCDNGRKEWDAAEKLTRPVTSQPSHPNGHSQLARAKGQPVRLSPTAVAARQAADQASIDYGWNQEYRHITAVGYDPRRARVQSINRDSADLDPGLAQELGSLPGYALGAAVAQKVQPTSRDSAELEPGLAWQVASLPGYLLPSHPTQKTDQGTWYKEPSIDFDSWAKHPRTSHGRVPAPPEAPLPVPPLRTEQRGRDLAQGKPLPQTPSNRSQPSDSSLQWTPSQQRAKPSTRTFSSRPLVFPRTPVKNTTALFCFQALPTTHS